MKLTSDLDFSLTKKRLAMMSRHSSALVKRSRASLLLILTFSIGLMFCTNSMPGFYPVEKIMMDGVVYTSDPILYSKGEWIETKIGTKHFKQEDLKMYTRNQEVFTGERLFIDSRNNQTAWTDHFENGLNTKTIYSDSELISLRNGKEYVHFYDNEKHIGTTVYDQDHNVVFKWEAFESGTRQYGPNEQLIFEANSTIQNGHELGYLKEWHHNGQLKFEMTSDSLGYQGLMTLYDEQGDVLQQELYKDGELIQKIK